MEKHLRVLRRNPVSLQFSEGNMEDPGNHWTVTSNPEKMVEQLILVVISKHVGKGYQEQSIWIHQGEITLDQSDSLL